MFLFKKPILLLFSLNLFVIMVFKTHAAPTGHGQFHTFDSSVAPPGLLESNWKYEKRYLKPEERDRRDQERQQRRLAFGQLSEKVVSTDCVPILTSTLVHLDNVRDFVYGRLKAKASFELLQPILGPLVKVLDMDKNCRFSKEIVSKTEDSGGAESSSSKAQITFGGGIRTKKVRERRSDGDYDIIGTEAWTEENEPGLLFKYRLRYLEKAMRVFHHVLKVAPKPVQQELELSGFLQETRILRENARSLLTCEGVPHVTVAGLKQKVGEKGTDSYVDRSEARSAQVYFYFIYHGRIVSAHLPLRPMRPMDPALIARCGLRNVTREPLEEEDVVDLSSFSSPLSLNFVWSNEDMMRMTEAVGSGLNGREEDPEFRASLFQD
ncbi:hypothetical protein BGZ81_004996 [Podila clonocystis]|nr:hypothetical protein BGZ81_004996 [Podila clonocystis]